MSRTLQQLQSQSFQTFYTSNAHRPWRDWLDATPLKGGKQGHVGLLHSKTTKHKCVYKVSQMEDYLIEHEYRILQSLQALRWCSHFIRVYGLLEYTANLHDPLAPLNPKDKHITRSMVLMECVPHIGSLGTLIEDTHVPDVAILGLMKQVLSTILIAQTVQFTHYDLHCENVLVTNSHLDEVLLYVFDEKTMCLFPSFGYSIRMIDVGFSYIPATDPDTPLYPSMAHTSVGFMSDRFDRFSDLKLFLISGADDIRILSPERSFYTDLSRFVRNVFKPLRINWKSGWDKTDLADASQAVITMCNEYTMDSTFFSRSNVWVDILQGLMNVPLSPLPYHSLGIALRTVVGQFRKFEERIRSHSLLHHLFKLLVGYARQYRGSYLRGGDERQWAILQFKQAFLTKFSKLVQYFNPAVHYEKLLCSLIITAQCVEGLLHEYIETRWNEKVGQYAELPLQSPSQYLKAFDVNFPTPVKFTRGTIVRIVDCLRKKEYTTPLHPQHILELNALPERSKASALYDLLKKNINK
jgi:hypothetical protein